MSDTKEEEKFIDEDELWKNDFGEYTNAVVYALRDKNNWKVKIFDDKITSKWRVEAKKQNIPVHEFDKGLRVLREMTKHKSKVARLKNEHYYNDDLEPRPSVVKQVDTFFIFYFLIL